ncbi:MAG: alpha/beta hydrolase [Chloroflexota bacterium]
MTLLLSAAIVSICLPRDGGMIAWLERRLLYFPSHDVAHPTSAFGAGAEDVWFGANDRLHGVYVPGRQRPDIPNLTVLYFHGTGGNLSQRAPLIRQLLSEPGVNAFIIDYQGYGKSRGQPSERATADDARAAIAYLQRRPDVYTDRIVYFGESLGGAVAIQLAAEAPPLGLIVQSSFTSLAEMTRLHYPMLSFLVPHATMRYDSLAAIRSVRAPLLLIHGESDSLIPIHHSQALQEAAGGPTQLYVVPGAGHNDVVVQGRPELWGAIRTFLTGLESSMAEP